jgi:hypothetical protein
MTKYNSLLRGIERINAKYELEMQRLLNRFAKADAATADALIASLPKKAKGKKTKLHWTQRPENKARLHKQMKKAAAAKVAKAS